MGVFPKMRKLTIVVTSQSSQGNIIIIKTTRALRARERLGLPKLLGLCILSDHSLPGIQDLLSLASCSNLQNLGCIFPNAGEMIASYMRQTRCAYLEQLPLWRSLEDDIVPFGPIADVLMTGKATLLRKIESFDLQKEDFDQLTKFIEAGLLPSLTELEVTSCRLDMATLAVLKDNPRLKNLLTEIDVYWFDMPTPAAVEVMIALFQAIQGGSF